MGEKGPVHEVRPPSTTSEPTRNGGMMDFPYILAQDAHTPPKSRFPAPGERVAISEREE